LSLTCHAFGFYYERFEELTRLFAIGLGDEKGEKTFDRVSIFVAFRRR